jgi:type III restriction enzyme
MTEAYEVPQPILNSPFEEPVAHWYIRSGRRPALVYPPHDERHDRQVAWSLADGTLKPSTDYAPAYEMVLVNLIRERVKNWRQQGYPGVTRTTLELLQHWRHEGRDENKRLSGGGSGTHSAGG